MRMNTLKTKKPPYRTFYTLLGYIEWSTVKGKSWRDTQSHKSRKSSVLYISNQCKTTMSRNSESKVYLSTNFSKKYIKINRKIVQYHFILGKGKMKSMM